jgi:GTP cyclohydrolase II
MNVNIGEQIEIKTLNGEFEGRHVMVSSDGHVIREGVVLQKANDRLPILVRVQSSCLFSESFWATDCDCARQIQGALGRISKDGGMLLYFYEEGRGAGLATKFKAIELQQSFGYDTRKAYECLRISPDNRTYEAAAAALLHLVGKKPVVILSNNRKKSDSLKEFGVNVVDRERLICGAENPDVRRYLDEKRRILGHDLPDWNIE